MPKSVKEHRAGTAMEAIHGEEEVQKEARKDAAASASRTPRRSRSPLAAAATSRYSPQNSRHAACAAAHLRDIKNPAMLFQRRKREPRFVLPASHNAKENADERARFMAVNAEERMSSAFCAPQRLKSSTVLRPTVAHAMPLFPEANRWIVGCGRGMSICRENRRQRKQQQ